MTAGGDQPPGPLRGAGAGAAPDPRLPAAGATTRRSRTSPSTCSTARTSSTTCPPSPAAGTSTRPSRGWRSRGAPMPVVVGIEHGGPERNLELSPFPFEAEPGQIAILLDWVTGHLMPALTAELNLVPGPLGRGRRRLLDGRAGRLLVALPLPAGVRRRAGDVPLLLGGRTRRSSSTSPRSPRPPVSRIYLDAGAREDKGKVVEAVQKMAEHLAERGYDSDRLMWRADAKGTHSEASLAPAAAGGAAVHVPAGLEPRAGAPRPSRGGLRPGLLGSATLDFRLRPRGGASGPREGGTGPRGYGPPLARAQWAPARAQGKFARAHRALAGAEPALASTQPPLARAQRAPAGALGKFARARRAPARAEPAPREYGSPLARAQRAPVGALGKFARAEPALRGAEPKLVRGGADHRGITPTAGDTPGSRRSRSCPC